MNKLPKAMLVVILASVLMGLPMLACSTQDTKADDMAPDFQLYNLEGELVSLSDFRGSPVILNFWATWCGPCISEIPYLQQVHEEWSDKGVVLLAVNMGESPSEVEQFVGGNNLSFPVLLDVRQEVAQMYGIRYIPSTFFIDKDGLAQAGRVGPFPNKQAIESEIIKIMP